MLYQLQSTNQLSANIKKVFLSQKKNQIVDITELVLILRLYVGEFFYT